MLTPVNAAIVLVLGLAITAAFKPLGRGFANVLVWMNSWIWTRLGWQGGTGVVTAISQSMFLLFGLMVAAVGALQLAGVPIGPV